MRPLASALAAAIVLVIALAPTALAVDLLPSEAKLGQREARLLVRSASGTVEVRAEPAVLAAGAQPGAPPEALLATPRTIAATHVWHGLDGIVEVVLVRDDPTRTVDVIVEDGSRTGVWVEWPGAPREVAAGPLVAAIALALAAFGSRRGA